MTFDDAIKSIKERYIQWNEDAGPGISIGIRNNSEQHFYNYGLSCLESNAHIKETTKFHAASLAKQVTALAISLLEIEGKVRSNDTAVQYLPEIIPHCAKDVTIKQLLNHTSGIRDQWVLLSLAGWKAYEPVTMGDIEYLVKKQSHLNYSPGTSHSYCNTGYTLLALIVEKVSGISFIEFVEENIFKPAEMFNSKFRGEFNESLNYEALAYSYKEIEKNCRVFYRSLPPLSVYGATSFITTTEDLLKWGDYISSLKRTGSDVYELFMETGDLGSGKPINYGRGLIHWKFNGETAIFHGGWDYGFSSFFLHFPDRQVSISILANCHEPNLETLAFYISSFVLNMASDIQIDTEGRLKKLEKNKSPTEFSVDVAEFSGLYQCESDLDIKPIKAIDQQLILDMAQGYDLVQIDRNKYAIQGTMVEIEFLNDDEMIFSSFGNEKYYKKISSAPPDLENSNVEGKYFSEELNVIYELSSKDDSLTVFCPRNESEKLEYLGSGVYLFSGMLVSFEESRGSGYTSMIINHPRAKNIRFNKIQ